jgi:hypothetical protein
MSFLQSHRNKLLLLSATFLGVLVVLWLKRPPSTSIISRYNLASGGSCQDACSTNPLCTAYSVAATDGVTDCVTYAGDPSKTWATSGDHNLFIKRLPSDPALFWSEYSECSQPCGGGLQSRTCSVSGKCPGIFIESCNTQPCPPKIEIQPVKTAPWFSSGSSNPFLGNPATSFADASTKCLAMSEKQCKMIMYHPTKNTFDYWAINDFSDTITDNTAADASTAVFGVKVPGSEGTFGAFPSCPCGAASTISRPCTSGVCSGPHFRKCANVPC